MSGLDRDLDREAGQQRDRRLRRSIVREWMAAGYRRHHHLAGLHGVGDLRLLSDWGRAEAECRVSPRPFATWLATQDIWQIEAELGVSGRNDGRI